jgi:polysaccharide export outer membrane protein
MKFYKSEHFPRMDVRWMFTPLIASCFLLAGCSMMSAAGPSSRAINAGDGKTVSDAGIRVIDVDDRITRQIISASHSELFSENPGDGKPAGSIVDKGDVLDIAIWEAPPAALFSATGGESRLIQSNSLARGTAFPEQMVNSLGQISIPFAGSIQAAGRTAQQIQQDIVSRLAGKAHKPQVIVRVTRNAASNVTVVGDVANSMRVPLTAKGERLLDALAAAGGVKQPVDKMTVQITRADHVASLPLETVIRDPRQNIRLQADDVVTALFQPFSFTALGATGQNAEIPFEGTGITLAQGLGRVGGLQDQRADVRGVFIFRLEDPATIEPQNPSGVHVTPNGKVPVIYRIDMRNPATFFIAQSFPIRNKDILYVSNAPLADLQKFVNILGSFIYPIITIQNSQNN